MSFRRTLPLLTQKSKSTSSSQWVYRQTRDPYVKMRMADPAAYRARSAFKLLEMNESPSASLAGPGLGFLDHEDVRSVVDLGAAPGGWSQVVAGKFGWGNARGELVVDGNGRYAEESEEDVAADEAENDLEEHDVEEKPHKKKKKMNLKKKKPKRREVVEVELTEYDPLNIEDFSDALSAPEGRGTIVAVDLLPIVPIPGVQTIQGDFLDESTTSRIQRMLKSTDNPYGQADVILSDMAANVSGNTARDSQKSLEICEAVFEFAKWNLSSADNIGRKKAGVLLIKFFAHPLLDRFRADKLEPNFRYVHYIKPDSSRAGSREGYFLCQGWDPLSR